MKTHIALISALTAINLALLVFNLAEARQAHADKSGVLTGTGLRIVDASGRVRASIEVLPADPNVRMPDGSRGYPETTLLRLIDEKGRPNVKVFASDQGQLIRTPVSQVRMVGRNTSGVIIFRTSEEEHVVSVERLADSGDDNGDDSEGPEEDGAPEGGAA